MEVNINNFNDFESAYKHIEDNALCYRYPHQIGSLFKELRDLKQKENNFDEVEKAQWEIDFFHFELENNELRPIFSTTNDKGEVVVYPSLDRFNNKTFEYLIDRFNNTNNPILKARYSHILWLSPEKHHNYAKEAVNSYLKLIKIYEKKDKEMSEEHFGLDVMHSAKNAYFIARQIKYAIEKVKEELKRLVLHFNFESSSFFALRANIIELMLKDKKIFSKEDFNGFGNICLTVAESLTEKGNIHGAIDMLEIGEKVDQGLGTKTHDWRQNIAEAFESLMRQTGRINLASIDFCQKAIENYKKIKDNNKIKELEKKYAELKDSTKLNVFSTEVNLNELINHYKEVVDRLTQESSEKIIQFLMHDKSLIPKFSDLKKTVEEDMKQFVLQGLFSRQILDQSGHTAQHFTDEEEKNYFDMLKQYNMEIRLNYIHLINEIFFSAIRKNKLSSSILLEFLNKYSWFGKNIPKKLANGETIEYNWLNLLAPSLHEYFLQMHYYFLNPSTAPNLVLCIDSLVLKFEGLLRAICNFSGVTTFIMTQDNKGRNIVREKDIHALLYEKPIRKLFDEDDLLLFKFLLVEKAGLNLRHKVAHSLMLFQNYSILYMHLLILTLLRLGKYDFVKEEEVAEMDAEADK